MTERYDDESRDSDEAIWQDAVTLTPADTKDAKIHVTMRLDANVYRAIVAEKKAMKERTITSTIERLLNKGLQSSIMADESAMRTALRNLVAHSVVQDTVLEMLFRHVKPRSSQDRELVEEFKKYSCASEDTKHVKQWLALHRYDATMYLDLVSRTLETPAPGESKQTQPARQTAKNRA